MSSVCVCVPSIPHFQRRLRPAKVKPKAIVDYNNHMLGVDKLDQLVSYYSFLHKWSQMVEEGFLLDDRGGDSQLLHHLQGACTLQR